MADYLVLSDEKSQLQALRRRHPGPAAGIGTNPPGRVQVRPRRDPGPPRRVADALPLRPEYATRHFQALAKEAGAPAIRLRDLRHTNASLALAAGVDLKVVSERLGHSQIAVTADLYTHVNRGVGRAAARQIAGILRPPAEAVPSAFLAQTPAVAPPEEADTDVYP
jgi:integrase